MKRIFSIRLNLDDMMASTEFLEGDAAFADWLRGFRVGSRGGPCRWGGGSPGADGYTIGANALAEAQGFQVKKSEGGKKSAKVRKEKHGTNSPRAHREDTSRTLQANAEDTSRALRGELEDTVNQTLIVNRVNSNPEIVERVNDNTNTKDTLAQPTVEHVPVEPDLFHEFWTTYNKSKGKDRAAKKWANLSMKVRKQIMEALPAYVQSTPDKQYRMDPTTYLNGKHWEDEIVSYKAQAVAQQDNGPEPVYDQAAVDAVTTDEHIKKAWDTAVRLGCAVLP